MERLDEDRQPVPGAEPLPEAESGHPQAAGLTEAGARLQESIAELTRAFLTGTAVEKDTARDRFEVALAAYSALLDADGRPGTG